MFKFQGQPASSFAGIPSDKEWLQDSQKRELSKDSEEVLKEGGR